MKNWIKKIGQNKFQFFFFLGLVVLLVGAIIISSTINTNDNNPPIEDQVDDHEKDNDDDDGKTTIETTEVVVIPLKAGSDYQVVRKFYEKDASKEDQAKALMKFENTYRASKGTSYALKNGDKFDVTASISGTVEDVGNSPIFGDFVIVSNSDGIKTYYYGLSETTVKKGQTIKQNDKLGVAGTSPIDKEIGNHVYFQISKNGNFLNPEKVCGTETTKL